MSDEGFALREFAPSDLPAIEALWVAAWSAVGLAIDFEARRPWLRDHLTSLARSGVAIVVGLDPGSGAVAGFVTIDPRAGHLDQLCVAPDARGGGVARALLNEAKRRAPGAIELDVNADNPRARQFYQREGFEIIARGSSALSGLPTLRLKWTSLGRDRKSGDNA